MDFQFQGPVKLQIDRMISAFPQLAQGKNYVEKLKSFYHSNEQSLKEPSSVFLCQALQDSKNN